MTLMTTGSPFLRIWARPAEKAQSEKGLPLPHARLYFHTWLLDGVTAQVTRDKSRNSNPRHLIQSQPRQQNRVFFKPEEAGWEGGQQASFLSLGPSSVQSAIYFLLPLPRDKDD